MNELNGGCSSMINRDPPVPLALSALAMACDEAVRQHGDDWAAISSALDVWLGKQPEGERVALQREIERILRFRPPSQSELQ